MSSEIKVSVCVVTYNQEKYIAECLQSLVDQKTDFKFEIIVGEDCSTDNTKAIVEEFQKKYPDIIRPMFHESNVGAVGNMLAAYRAAKGKYIAHVDGDDLALPYKLQYQFNALEKNPDCMICSHDVNLINAAGKDLGNSFRKHKSGINTLLDLYETLPFFAHSSKMFVNDLLSNYWNDFHSETLDIEIHVQQAKLGNIFHLAESYGCYRVFTGVTTSTKLLNPMLPNGTRRIFKQAFQDGKIKSEVLKRQYAQALFNYAYQAAVMGDRESLRKYIKESIDLSLISKKQNYFYKLSAIPSIVIIICKTRAFFKL